MGQCVLCETTYLQTLCPPDQLSFCPLWSSKRQRSAGLIFKPRFHSPLTRLSSLTVGDSERKSSAAQQREPTLDIPVESTGHCRGVTLATALLTTGLVSQWALLLLQVLVWSRDVWWFRRTSSVLASQYVENESSWCRMSEQVRHGDFDRALSTPRCATELSQWELDEWFWTRRRLLDGDSESSLGCADSITAFQCKQHL